MFIACQIDIPQQRRPIANWVLIGIACIFSVSLVYAIANARTPRQLPMRTHIDHNTGDTIYEPTGSATPKISSLVLQPDNFNPIQLIAAGFSYPGTVRLAGNILFLWIFGNAVNGRLGNSRYIVFYLLASVIGAGVYAMLGPPGPYLGPSAALMALVGGLLVAYPKSNFVAWRDRGRNYSIAAYWIAAICIAFEIWQLASGSAGSAAYMQHITAFIFGAVAMAGALRWNQVAPGMRATNLLDLLKFTQRERQRSTRR